MANLHEAKKRLDLIKDKPLLDLCKMIQVAEILRRSRLGNDTQAASVDSVTRGSLSWSNQVATRLLGGLCSSTSIPNLWDTNFMPVDYFVLLDKENRRTGGLVERYIYKLFAEKQEKIFSVLKITAPKKFDLQVLLDLFVRHVGSRSSIDKAYEIAVRAVFQTVMSRLPTRIRIQVPKKKRALFTEFTDLAEKLLGLNPGETEWEQAAYMYRIGVTSAADRGLDMWANFGPAIQVKHLILDEKLAEGIVDQVESDHIIVVCRDADAKVIRTIAKQIGWGRRVRGIVVESDLVRWYERCLRGRFASELAQSLMTRLRDGFKDEFPQIAQTARFMQERGYDKLKPTEPWRTETDNKLAP